MPYGKVNCWCWGVIKKKGEEGYFKHKKMVKRRSFWNTKNIRFVIKGCATINFFGSISKY